MTTQAQAIKTATDALKWYLYEAQAMSKHLEANMVEAVLASATALKLDAGGRAEKAIAALAAIDAAAVPALEEPAFPERDSSKPAEAQGIFRKFDVRRIDGSDAPGGKHHGCRYFVLDMDHDAHAAAALNAYGVSCKDTHPQLSADLLREFPAQPPAPLPQGAQSIASDDDLERIANQAGWNNRRYMTIADYSAWCARMREFARLAKVPQGEQCPSGLIDLLKSLRPTHGTIGSRDIDVTEQRRKIDAAIAMLATPAQPVAAQPAQKPVKLQHMAVAENGVLRWMSGRKIDNCELYAMPDFGRAPDLYTASTAHLESKDAEPAKWAPLSDVQWMNIVNHDHAYEGYSVDDAVHEAVKLTEAKLKESNDRAANAASKSNGSDQ